MRLPFYSSLAVVAMLGSADAYTFMQVADEVLDYADVDHPIIQVVPQEQQGNNYYSDDDNEGQTPIFAEVESWHTSEKARQRRKDENKQEKNVCKMPPIKKARKPSKRPCVKSKKANKNNGNMTANMTKMYTRA